MKNIGFIFILLFLFSTSNEALSQDNDSIQRRPKIGLVLSGGGAKGFAQIGALKVIEEAGLHFDYIGGTSIGSLIGGFYAAGYSPQVLASLIREQNWNALMTDQIPRKYIPIEDKFNTDRFLVSFPIRNRKVGMKSALYSGVLPELLFARMLSPTYKIFDYEKLPTPFFCVATNLVNGTAEEFNSGILHRSMRASMSIPGYFKPVEINNKLYVDGGVIDNYPAQKLKDKGCDIIVGIDVQAKMHDKKQLYSIVNIFDQLISFNGVSDNEKNMQLIDYNIHPKIESFGVLDFNSFDTLMAIGEQAAREQLPRLKNLADSLYAIEPYDTCRAPSIQPLDSILITGFVFDSTEMEYANYIRNAFRFETPSKIAYSLIDNGIMQLYGSGLFQQIYYYLVPDGEGAKLAIDCQEMANVSLNVGFHYDSDYKVGVLLNTTLTNMTGKGSKLYVDLNIGENSSFMAHYISNRSKHISIGSTLKISGIQFNQYNGNLVTNIYSNTQNSLDVFAQLRRKDQRQLRIGANINYSRFKSIFYYNEKSPYCWYFCPTFSYIIDTYNKTFFSTRGTGLSLLAKYVVPLNDLTRPSDKGNAIVAQFNFDHNSPISRRITLKYGINAGAKLGVNKLPMQYRFFVGGQSRLKYYDNFIPFTGLKFVEASGEYLLFGKFACQYKVYKKLYATLHYDMGWLDDDFDTLLHGDKFYSGYGLTLGYDSLIGPIEISIMGSNWNSKVSGFLNIGYWF